MPASATADATLDVSHTSMRQTSIPAFSSRNVASLRVIDISRDDARTRCGERQLRSSVRFPARRR